MIIQELRIGNYMFGNILHKYEIVEVNKVSINGFHYDALNVHGQEYQTSCHIDRSNPIPLTEDVLLKFGFENGNKEASNCDLWDWHYIGSFKIYKESGHFEYNDVKILYVHHLQNIYFDIEGKELKFLNENK